MKIAGDRYADDVFLLVRLAEETEEVEEDAAAATDAGICGGKVEEKKESSSRFRRPLKPVQQNPSGFTTISNVAVPPTRREVGIKIHVAKREPEPRLSGENPKD